MHRTDVSTVVLSLCTSYTILKSQNKRLLVSVSNPWDETIKVRGCKQYPLKMSASDTCSDIWHRRERKTDTTIYIAWKKSRFFSQLTVCRLGTLCIQLSNPSHQIPIDRGNDYSTLHSYKLHCHIGSGLV
jgi:hypothetical protein